MRDKNLHIGLTIAWREEAALDHAVKPGVALQMTNILRDIGEDARRNPIYIPLDKMRRFGYSKAELMVGVINDSFRQRYQMILKRVDGV